MVEEVLDATLCFRHRHRRSRSAQRVRPGAAAWRASGRARRAAPRPLRPLLLLAPARACPAAGAGRGSRRARRGLEGSHHGRRPRRHLLSVQLRDGYEQQLPVPPQYQRSFDQNSNTFTLSYAKLGIGMTSTTLRFAWTSAMARPVLPSTGTRDPASPGRDGRHGTDHQRRVAVFAQQAFLTLTPITNLTIDFGKFMTMAWRRGHRGQQELVAIFRARSCSSTSRSSTRVSASVTRLATCCRCRPASSTAGTGRVEVDTTGPRRSASTPSSRSRWEWASSRRSTWATRARAAPASSATSW